MFKTALMGLTVASIFGAGVAFAAEAVKVEPGTGPTEAVSKEVPDMKPATGAAATPVTCTQAELTGLITKAGALTDKNKQKMAMGHLDLAKKSLDAKDMEGCAKHMKEANVSLGTVTK